MPQLFEEIGNISMVTKRMTEYINAADGDWNPKLEIKFEHMTVEEREEYKMYFHFKTFAEQCIELASGVTQTAENLEEYIFDETEEFTHLHIALFNILDIEEMQANFDRGVRGLVESLKEEQRNLLGVAITRFPNETADGYQGLPRNMAALMPIHQIRGLEYIGYFMRTFEQSILSTTRHAKALHIITRRYHGDDKFVDAVDLIEIYKSLEEELDDIYETFLEDKASFAGDDTDDEYMGPYPSMYS